MREQKKEHGKRDFAKKDGFSQGQRRDRNDLRMDEELSEREPREDVICGRNSVIEALKSGRPAESLLVAKGERSGSIGQILSLAAKKDVTVKEVSPAKLDFMCGNTSHQGVAFICAAAPTVSVEELFEVAHSRDEDPFFVICDGIKDPHNLGAIIRSAEAVGAHGVIIPKRRNAGLTAAVSKAASGALEYVPVAKVTNLSACIDELKEKGLWVYGADMDGTDYMQCELSGPIALVIGSEGEGLGRLVKEKCDGIVSMPMCGRVNSLNASVAAGVLLYRIHDCRRKS